MRAIFLADAHLCAPEDANYQLMLQFISSLEGTVDTLCILGDLFDFRIGLASLTFAEHEPILDALRRLRDSGTRLVYLEGNHDFLLGADFTQRLGAELHVGPVVLELQGKRIYLCHGDLINRRDWSYQLLYRLLRHPATLYTGQLLPPSLVMALRDRLQRSSKKQYTVHQHRWNYQAIIRSFADVVRQQGCDALVLGHFHQPFIEELDRFTLVALGDWISQSSYAELADGTFRLLSYRNMPSEPALQDSTP